MPKLTTLASAGLGLFRAARRLLALALLNLNGVVITTQQSSTGITLGDATGAAEGDLMVAVVLGNKRIGTPYYWLVPAGWTKEFDSGEAGYEVPFAIFSRIRGAVADNPTFSISATGSAFSGSMMSFKNAQFGVVGASDNYSIAAQVPVQSIDLPHANASLVTVAYSYQSGALFLIDGQAASLGVGVTPYPTLALFPRTAAAAGSTGQGTVVNLLGAQCRALQFSVLSRDYVRPQARLLGSTQAQAVNSAVLSIPKPANTPAGSWLVAYMCDDGPAWAGTPAGWTEPTAPLSTTPRMRLLARQVGNAEPASYDFPLAAPGNPGGGMVAVSATNPNLWGGPVAGLVRPQYVTAADNELLLHFYMQDGANNTLSPPAGWETYDYNDDAGRPSWVVGTRLYKRAGTTVAPLAAAASITTRTACAGVSFLPPT